MDNIEPIYQELAGKVTKEKNKTLPTVLKRIASLDQARMMRELPAQIEALAEKLGLDK